MEGIGKLLIGGAVVLLVLGELFVLVARFGLEQLPVDLVVRRINLTVYFAIVMIILLSVVGTIVLDLLFRR